MLTAEFRNAKTVMMAVRIDKKVRLGLAGEGYLLMFKFILTPMTAG
jgi:hypothetical protein